MIDEVFTHGQTVRLIGVGTPSQRQCLWVVDLSNHMGKTDWGNNYIDIRRFDDPDCALSSPRKYITAATILDLLVGDGVTDDGDASDPSDDPA